MTLIRKSYSISYKLKVIQHHSLSGSSQASTCKHFSLAPSMLSRWLRDHHKFQAEPRKSMCKPGSGRHVQHPLSEILVNRWIADRRTEGHCVTYTHILTQMRTLSGIEVTHGWLYGFMSRFKLSLREITNKILKSTPRQQELTDTTNERVATFQDSLNELIQEQDISDSALINMDETPIWLNMPHRKTVTARGEKKVSAKMLTSDRNKITVVLCCAADGTKLPPVIVSNVKIQQPRIPYVVSEQESRVYQQANSHMSGVLTERWVDHICCNYKPGERKVLMIDSFSGHLTDQVKQACLDNRIDHIQIPAGCTSLCQPLDLTVNRSFKANVRRLWNDMMVDHVQNAPAQRGQIGRDNLKTIVKCVHDAWEAVPTHVVKNGFIKALRRQR